MRKAARLTRERRCDHSADDSGAGQAARRCQAGGEGIRRHHRMVRGRGRPACGRMIPVRGPGAPIGGEGVGRTPSRLHAPIFSIIRAVREELVGPVVAITSVRCTRRSQSLRTTGYLPALPLSLYPLAYDHADLGEQLETGTIAAAYQSNATTMPVITSAQALRRQIYLNSRAQICEGDLYIVVSRMRGLGPILLKNSTDLKSSVCCLARRHIAVNHR